MAIIRIPEALREKLSPKATDALVEVLNQVEQSSRDDTLIVVEQKFEKRLSEESGKLNQRITEESSRLDKRITEESARLDIRISQESGRLDKRIAEECAKLGAGIAHAETRILRWLVILWTSQIAAAHFWR